MLARTNKGEVNPVSDRVINTKYRIVLIFAAQNPFARCDDHVVLDFLETGGVPVTAQLTAAGVHCEYEQLYVRHSLPAAFAANMRSFPLRMVRLRDSTAIVFDVAAQLALAVKVFGQID